MSKAELFCGPIQGLQMLEKETGRIILLASEAPTDGPPEARKRIQYANDLVIASDGTIYFTDSSDIPPAFNMQTGFYDTLAAYFDLMYRASFLPLEQLRLGNELLMLVVQHEFGAVICRGNPLGE